MKLTRRIKTLTAVILVVSLLLSTGITAFGTELSVQKTETAYAEENTAKETVETILYAFGTFLNSVINIGGTQTSPESDSPTIATPFFIVLMWEEPRPFSKVKSVLFVGTELNVISYSGSYCFVETKSSIKGYVFSGWIMNKPESSLSLNRKYDHVYHDGTNFSSTTQKPRTQAIYNGSGKVRYSTDNTDIISVDSNTGLITGKKPGKANLIAKVGDKEDISIPVYCVYRWDKPWTGKAKKSTTVYSGTSTSTTSLATISSGKKFVVRGDDGDSDGWAYGYIQGTGTWGFVKINDISTKSTISYYNGLNWLWPIKDTSFNFISSSYGPRNVDVGSSNHKGIDVSGNNILGEPLIAPFDGIVRKSGYDSGCGNYICITSETIDPITGENLIVIYMHMKSTALYDKGEEVSKGETVGYIGTTGTSSGPHLHAEMNNKNAAVGESARTTYTYTINPLYFYRDMELRFYVDEAYKNHGGYWYSTNN